MITPASLLLENIKSGTDILIRQIFVMFYGSFETYLFELMVRSYPKIGITTNISNQASIYL